MGTTTFTEISEATTGDQRPTMTTKRTCIICGQRFGLAACGRRDNARKTCSKPCAVEARRQSIRRHLNRRYATDPEFRAERLEYARRYRSSLGEDGRRRRAENHKQWAAENKDHRRDYYRKNSTKILEQNRRRKQTYRLAFLVLKKLTEHANAH